MGQIAATHQALAKKNKARADRGTIIPWKEKLKLFRMLDAIPTARQQIISQDAHRFIVVNAGRRSGKTFIAALEIIAQLLLRPGSSVLVAAPFQDQAERLFDLALAHLDRLVPQMGLSFVERQTYRLSVKLSNGSTLEGGSGQFVDTFRGISIDLLVIDEAAVMTDLLWREVLEPALADRRGRALFISTPVRGSWFERLYDHAVQKLRRLAFAEGFNDAEVEAYVKETIEWSFHVYPMWENTASFPGGADDPEIRRLRRSMNADDFLQEVAAVSMPSPDLVYPQFRPEVHVARIPVIKQLDIELGIDPSNGVNNYAITAMQDLKTRVHIVAEFAQRGVLAEEVIEACSRTPWWPRVKFAVMDSAAVYDLRIWQSHPKVKFDVIPVQKPKIEERFGLIRQWLLDPAAYDKVLMAARKASMESHGFKGEWERLSAEDKMEIEIYARASVPASELRKCARLFIDHTCLNTIQEFTTYKYNKRKDTTLNWPDRPRDADDHNMDAISYWFWMIKRYDAGDIVASRESRPYAVDGEGFPAKGLLTDGALFRDPIAANAFSR